MPTGLLGVLAMVGSGLFVNVMLTLLTFISAKGWSDSTMLSVGCGLGLGLLLVWFLASRPCPPDGRDIKWILSVGFFGASSSILMFLAVQVGIPLGDFAAMNSTNTVFAAFLGRLFLGEALQCPHYAAVLMSLAGALLISRPEALFGAAPEQEAASESSSAWIGYVLALLSGFCDACMYVFSRKAGHVHQVFIHLSVIGQLSLATAGSTLLLGGFDFSPFATSPAEAAGWLAAILVVGSVAFLLFIEAAQKCPAAVSATVDTATRMTSGYGAQLLLFGATLTAETAVGAGLMLGSVAFMALARGEPEPDDRPAEEEAPGGDGTAPELDLLSENSAGSLASFAASEFARTPSRRLALRLRRPAQQPAQVLGAALSALPGPPCLPCIAASA